MNTHMFHNPIVQDNLKKLAGYGYEIIAPDHGYLACGDIGDGKMPSEQVLFEAIEKELAFPKDFEGRRILVTAGPTIERLDPVRFLSNHSSGKMGYAIAKHCMLRGAKVTLVTGKTALSYPPYVDVVPVESAKEMFEAVTSCFDGQDIVIKAAAVADYRPAYVADEKMKKKDGELSIPLERTEDILKTLGERKRPGQFLCGFSMETEHMLENSKAKLEKKNLDMIVANNVKQEGAGFGVDTNVVTFITKNSVEELPVMSKEDVAEKLLDAIRQNLRSE